MQVYELNLGISVFLSQCNFSAEIALETVPDAIAEIDDHLTKNGLSSDSNKRVAWVMQNVDALSVAVMKGEMAQEDSVVGIAMGFVYAFVQEQGLDKLANLRGLIACLVGDKLYLQPCLDRKSYEDSAQMMRIEAARMMMDYDDEDMVDMIVKKPTIH